jgi:hypothetical protein
MLGMNKDLSAQTPYHMLGVYLTGAIMGAALIASGLLIYAMASLEYIKFKDYDMLTISHLGLVAFFVGALLSLSVIVKATVLARKSRKKDIE